MRTGRNPNDAARTQVEAEGSTTGSDTDVSSGTALAAGGCCG